MKDTWDLIKETFSEWSKDRASTLAAALAYYTAFSIAPLLVIVIAISGLAFSTQMTEGRIMDQIRGMLGDTGARAVQDMISHARNPKSGIMASLIGTVALVFGATGLFAQLQDTLNTIWDVAAKPGAGIGKMLKDRFLSFAMILGVGFLLLVSLVLSAALAGVGKFIGSLFPGMQVLAWIVSIAVSLAVVTLLFAMIYKILPDVRIRWRDVWVGAAATSILFEVGKSLIGLYLGRSAVSSSYGAAGALAIVLLWVYYTAQILLMGAEFTQVWARHFGTQIVPDRNAVPIEQTPPEDRPGVKKGGEKVPVAAFPRQQPHKLPFYGSVLLGLFIGLVFSKRKRVV